VSKPGRVPSKIRIVRKETTETKDNIKRTLPIIPPVTSTPDELPNACCTDVKVPGVISGIS
jgi:hypothetical protein